MINKIYMYINLVFDEFIDLFLNIKTKNISLLLFYLITSIIISLCMVKGDYGNVILTLYIDCFNSFTHH
jgi:hypothetical protein